MRDWKMAAGLIATTGNAGDRQTEGEKGMKFGIDGYVLYLRALTEMVDG